VDGEYLDSAPDRILWAVVPSSGGDGIPPYVIQFRDPDSRELFYQSHPQMAQLPAKYFSPTYAAPPSAERTFADHAIGAIPGTMFGAAADTLTGGLLGKFAGPVVSTGTQLGYDAWERRFAPNVYARDQATLAWENQNHPTASFLGSRHRSLRRRIRSPT
jgi:hypothetical protein